MGERGLRVFFAIMLWTGLVMLAAVAIVEVSTGAAVEAVAGDYIRSTARAEIAELARKSAQDAASDDHASPMAKDWAEGIQAAMTSLGIAIAGGWAAYVFFLGRSSVGVVQLQIEPQRLLEAGTNRGVVVRVTIKNVGRTRVGKSVSRIRAEPLDEEQLGLSMKDPNVVPAALPRTAELGTVLFSKHITEREEAVDALEPGQETSEEVVVVLGDIKVARVEAVFIGRIRPLFRMKDRTFSSRIYLDTEVLEANGTSEGKRSEKRGTMRREET